MISRDCRGRNYSHKLNRPYRGFDHHFDGEAKDFVVFRWGCDVK